MPLTDRRLFLRGLALGAGAVATRHAIAAGDDGHAAGYDAVPASRFTPLIPRREGQPPAFTYPLDRGSPKAVSGGWARDVTMRALPISEDIAGRICSSIPAAHARCIGIGAPNGPPSLPAIAR